MTEANSRAIHCQDILYSLALFLLTALSRLPFRSQIMYHWDSVNFAFAMLKFDVAADRPQSPGYIVYVWICRIVDALFHDPQTTMVWITIASSGLAAVAMYLLGRTMFDRRVGLASALMLASGPLFWFYGEIALPHTLDTFLVILSAWLLYEVALGRVWAVAPAAVSLAVAGGIRQQTPVFLALLALFAGVRFLQRIGWRRGWRWGALAVGVFGLLCAAWFFPLINSVGGLARYRQIMGGYAEHYNTATSVFLGAGAEGLMHNLRKLGIYTLYGMSAALLPLAVYMPVRLWRRKWMVRWERGLFGLAWILPSLIFYTLIHMGQQGLIFVYLPVLLLLSARALIWIVERREQPIWAVAMALVVVVNAALFIGLPEYPLGSGRFKVLSWDTLRNNDAYYQDRFNAIREHLPAESTVVVAARWRHVQWYLPEYPWLPFNLRTQAGKSEFRAEGLGLTGEMNVVLFDPELESFNRASAKTFLLPLEHGGAMTFLRLRPGETLCLGEREIEVKQ